MSVRPAKPLLALLLVGSAACSSGSSGTSAGSSGTTSSGGDTEPANMAGMVEAHNAARAAVMPPASPAIPPLVWSDAAAAAAQSWASQCMFSHMTDGYGQNIFAGTGTYAPKDVVTAWVAEDANYDYATNTCAPNLSCGHYTQVVWRDTSAVGCGVASCTQNSPFGGGGSWTIWVCNYSPPGNFVGDKPY